MPAKTTSLPTPRQNRRGEWVTQWYTGRIIDGKPERKTRSFGRVTRAQALTLWREFMLIWHPGYIGAGADGGTTVNAVADLYQSHADGYYRGSDGRPTGEADMVRYALAPLRALHGETPIDSLEPRHLMAYQSVLAETLARSTCNARLGIVKRMLSWAVLHGHLSPAVKGRLVEVKGLAKGRTRAKEAAPKTCVAWLAVERTLVHCPPTIRAMVLLQWWTGMRPGEVCAMTTGQIDMSREPWVFAPVRHKTAYRGRRRVVYIGPEGRAIIHPFIRIDLSAPLFDPRQAHRERADARVADYDPGDAADYRTWPSYQRRAAQRRTRANSAPAYNTRTYCKAVWYACDRAGISRWSPNQLRRSALTRIERDHGRVASSLVAGHAKLDTTAIYVERDDEAAAKIVERCG